MEILQKVIRTIRYTIHEHRARKAGVHYDLRLQKKNDVYSFALPKSKIPDDKTVYLAVLSHIDHNNLRALSFTGSIANGNYGAGNLSILETGKYEILDWTDNSDKIIFYVPQQFTGQILFGKFYLIKTTSEKNNYVFGKSRDQNIN